MAAICVTPIKGTHVRIVKVDACGIVVTGTGAMSVVTKGFVKVDMEPQYEDGQEYFERNADGDACVNQKDAPVLKRMQLTVELCEVDPVSASWMLSARQLLSGTDIYGWAMTEGSPTNRFSMEVWQRVAGAGACAPGGAVRYIYNAWPNTGAVKMGTYTIENGRSAFTFTAETAAASVSGWGDGPGTITWLPGGLPVGATDHWLWGITTNAPPTAACGSVTPPA